MSTIISNLDFQCRSPEGGLNALKTIPPGLLEQAVERLKSEFQPEQIWLFGSHAWGTPTEDSDVDLMVIVPSSAVDTMNLGAISGLTSLARSGAAPGRQPEAEMARQVESDTK